MSPLPSIQAAVDTRIISNKHNKQLVNELYSNSKSIKSSKKSKDVDELKNALLAARIMVFAQGLDLIRTASSEFDWQVSLPELVDIWRAGCIIRSNILENISESAGSVETIDFLGNDPVKRLLKDSIDSLPKSVLLGVKSNIPLPVMSSSLQYFNSLAADKLNLNIIQAQRDYFGGHGYQRIDTSSGEISHTDWSQA